MVASWWEVLRSNRNNVTGKAAARLVISGQTFHTRVAILGSSHFDRLDSIGGGALCRRSSSLESHYSEALPRCQPAPRSASSTREEITRRTHIHAHAVTPYNPPSPAATKAPATWAIITRSETESTISAPKTEISHEI